MNKKKHIISDQVSPRDGLDNTGTQGYDSLSDDAYQRSIKKVVPIDNQKDDNLPFAVKDSSLKGEKIIFDLIIREKLAHAIIIKDDRNYHINLDGEDLGRFQKDEDGTIHHFPQSKGDIDVVETFFKPIELKLNSLNK